MKSPAFPLPFSASSTGRRRPALPGPAPHRLEAMARVDHAGEHGAVVIYAGQQAVFGARASTAPLNDTIGHMADGEAAHVAFFDGLVRHGTTSPTKLMPFWQIAGYTLGVGTALMGPKAAFACTAAVEDVIEKHYQDQINELGDAEPVFVANITQFRLDEIGHHDTAIAEGAEATPGYWLLRFVIQTGCRIAIRVSERF